jgi:hypothetical protein
MKSRVVRKSVWFLVSLLLIAQMSLSQAALFNLKVVTDASPDYLDVPSLLHSATSKWASPAEKCWALFYWNHIARRQTAPMMLHGLALTDPIRQFNDYGYAMCSTVSGINCALWDAMGLKSRYWDISLHTVSEVAYDGRWHMYDNSMSALYTLCDGSTIAGVEDIGQDGACAASGGKVERGHIAKYHCLNATSAHGFLTGADTIRGLEEEARCFNPNGLKYRSYFYDWDRGHRYILNLRQDESYTRYYRSLGTSPGHYVPNEGKDPEKVNERYRIRGNGVWSYQPELKAASLAEQVHESSGLLVVGGGGLAPAKSGEPGHAIFKLQGANVITSVKVRAGFTRVSGADLNRISVSTVNGLVWRPVWTNDQTGEREIELQLVDEVNGAYEVLVKVELLGASNALDARLRRIQFETVTMLNSKTQPQLLLGRNTVDVRAGPQTDSIVFWPDLRDAAYKPYVVEEKNVRTASEHPGYMGVLHAERPGEEAYVVFKVDSPRPISAISYGGRLYNRAPGSRIELLHSFDHGATWARTYALTNTAQPWDVIHYETLDVIPPGKRSVLFKYALNSPSAGSAACSIYAVRMEVNHEPACDQFKPVEVTFRWSERQADYSLVERSHTEVAARLPHRYTINVGGADHPVVQSLRVRSLGPTAVLETGYSDQKDVGGEKFVSRWVTYGKNLAKGKAYTVSVPSTTQWGSGDPDGTKLTDGVVGPPYPGAIAPTFALGWNKGSEPEVTVDLGAVQKCGAFRIQIGAGWPWWDALKGEVKDRVELLTSMDGHEFMSHGQFDLNLRWKDLPANHMWPDEEVIAAHPYELLLPQPVSARFVRYKITPERSLTVSEVEVFDRIGYKPFDLRVALPE